VEIFKLSLVLNFVFFIRLTGHCQLIRQHCAATSAVSASLESIESMRNLSTYNIEIPVVAFFGVNRVQSSVVPGVSLPSSVQVVGHKVDRVDSLRNNLEDKKENCQNCYNLISTTRPKYFFDLLYLPVVVDIHEVEVGGGGNTEVQVFLLETLVYELQQFRESRLERIKIIRNNETDLSNLLQILAGFLKNIFGGFHCPCRGM